MKNFQTKLSSTEKIEEVVGIFHHPSPDIPLDYNHPLHKCWSASSAQHMKLLVEKSPTIFMGIDKTKHVVAMNCPYLIQRHYHPNDTSDSHPNFIVGEINQMEKVVFVELALHEQKPCEFSIQCTRDRVANVSPATQGDCTETIPLPTTLAPHDMFLDACSQKPWTLSRHLPLIPF